MMRALMIAMIVAMPLAASERGPVATTAADLRAGARVDQRIGERLPLDLTLVDEAGSSVRLGDLFTDGKPVLITPVYYSCPMLCNMVLDQLNNKLADLRLNVGRDFNIVTYSFDPTESPEMAAGKKRVYVRRYGREGAAEGWHFLTGDSATVRQLSDALGFAYAWDPKRNEYAHGATVIVATPDGTISRYFYGIEYSTRDLRLGLVEASENRIGTLTDQVLLLCYYYDPASGKYSARAMNIVRMSGAVTVFGLAGFILFLIRRERLNSKS